MLQRSPLQESEDLVTLDKGTGMQTLTDGCKEGQMDQATRRSEATAVTLRRGSRIKKQTDFFKL